jgi:uncharacterized protein
MLSRTEALKLVNQHVANRNLVKHMIAVEADMRRIALHFQEDEEIWAMAGLLHDLDYAETVEHFDRHGFRTVEILKDLDLPEAILYAIKAHPGHVPCLSRMDQALYSVDPLTGLIIASVLMHPQKKLAALDADYVLRRFKEKRFAAGANRDQIQACTEFGLPLEEFVKLGLQGMVEVADELGF